MRTTDDAAALEVVRVQPGIGRASGGEHGLNFEASEQDVGELSLALARSGVGILALTPELATLEDLFFRLTEDSEASPSGDRLNGSPGPGTSRDGSQPRAAPQTEDPGTPSAASNTGGLA
jgi:hypothetical protein